MPENDAISPNQSPHDRVNEGQAVFHASANINQRDLPDLISDRQPSPIPYNVLLQLYGKTLSTQLQQELEVNTAALPHKYLHRDEKIALRLRNIKIEQAKTILEESKQPTELSILRVAAIATHCPIPTTHEFINGETSLTFSSEPDIISLTHLLKSVEPLVRHKDANPQFIKYIANLRDKYSQVLLDEAMNNGEKQGIGWFKLRGGFRITGIARDYLAPEAFRPKAIDKLKNDLHTTLIRDIKKFSHKHRKFTQTIAPPSLASSNQDFFPELTALMNKVTHKGYVMGAEEINEFIKLTKNHAYFQPDKKLRQTQRLIEDTATLRFDSIRTEKARKKMTPVIIFSQLFALGGGVLNHQQVSDSINHALAQPDGDPLRLAQAVGNIVDLGDYYIDHRTEDPAKTILTYLEDPNHVRPVASYLLYDYFESLQHFPEADRTRLVDKATTFVNEVAARYQLPDDPNHDSLVQYLMATAEDPEMQDLLGYTVLPFLAYAAENENTFAWEQWLYQANQLVADNPEASMAKNVKTLSDNPHIQKLIDAYVLPHARLYDATSRDELYYQASIHLINGDYAKLIPLLDKAVALLREYDPDNIRIDFDHPDKFEINGELITIPHDLTEALSALPPNPNYLTPEQFMEASQTEYIKIWHELYGLNSDPPDMYWSPVKIQPDYVNQDMQHFIDITTNRQEGVDNYHFQSDENKDWFTRATIDSPSQFKDIYLLIPPEDPYSMKFANAESFLAYFQDYTNFIKANGSPETPMPESDLFAYALVKCRGNYTEAKQEMAMLYKLMARYDIESGKRGGYLNADLPMPEHTDPEQYFYRTRFLEFNLPLLLSISNETIRMQDFNDIVPILRQLDIRLVDQQDDAMYEKDQTLRAAYAFGTKDIDIAEMYGIVYHLWSQDALVSSGIANPSAIAISHAKGEIPFWLGDEGFLDTTENSSNKAAVIALAGLDLIALRNVIQEELPRRSISDSNPLPTIYTVSLYSNSQITEKVVAISPELSAITVTDPNNPYQQTLYYGSPDLIKLFAEKGYAPANFSSDIYSENAVSPELLNFFLSSGISIPYSYYYLDIYAEADQAQVAKILMDHKISVIDFPENLDNFLRLGVDVSIEDITTLINDPTYYSRIAEALPYLGKMGLVKPNHPFVKSAINENAQLTYEYYITLSPDDKYTLKQLYPNVEWIIESYVMITIEDATSDRDIQFSTNQINEFFPILLHALRCEHKDTTIDKLNYLLPYLSTEQLTTLIENPRFTEKDLIELFNPGYFMYGPDRYPNLSEALARIESTLADRSDLMLYFSPAMFKAGVWDVNADQDRIDSLITENLERHNLTILTSAYTLNYLQSLGYSPSPELLDKLISESTSLLQSHNVDYYSLVGVEVIYGNYVSAEQFGTLMDYLANLQDEDAHNFSGRLFYERFSRYASYYENDVTPINSDERDLLNMLMTNDAILPFLGGEGGLLSTYYEFADYLTEENAHRLYDLSVSTLSERERYNLVEDMKSHNFHPQTYVFNRDKFIEEVYKKYTSEGWYMFDASSNDFVKNNLTFDEFMDIFQFITKEKGFFEMYIDENIAQVFNHDYFVTIPGYSKEREQQFVSDLIEQLSTTDMEYIPYQSYYIAPYLISQRPNFDYGPYFVAWVNKTYGLRSTIEDNSYTIRLFLETAKHVQPKYWEEIKSNDLEKYEYLQQLIRRHTQHSNPRRRNK